MRCRRLRTRQRVSDCLVDVPRWLTSPSERHESGNRLVDELRDLDLVDLENISTCLHWQVPVADKVLALLILVVVLTSQGCAVPCSVRLYLCRCLYLYLCLCVYLNRCTHKEEAQKPTFDVLLLHA